MHLQLSEDIMAGMKAVNDVQCPYASIDVVLLKDKEETPIVTVRAVQSEPIQIQVDWHDESYAEDPAVRRLMDAAQRECIMFLLF